jgi:hypothetical protein
VFLHEVGEIRGDIQGLGDVVRADLDTHSSVSVRVKMGYEPKRVPPLSL